MGIENIINELKNNPMFRLSLGSKELFHSNFLEFLWDSNHGSFFNMLKELGCKRTWNDETYVLSREKENFDICIFHKKGNKICYDLIIENKVKSIPRKEQLKEYYEKARDHGSSNVDLILLSLVEEFPDKSIIEQEKFKKECGNWRIVNYNQLYDAISKVYSNTDNTNYITDYCYFINQMHSLQSIILGEEFENEAYYKGEEQKLLEKVRLHDLYIKLRASKFISLLELKLEQKLEKEGIAKVITIPCDDYKKYDDIRQKTKDEIIRVFLNYTIQSGTGMIAAFIYKKGNNGDKIIEVVIQGDQYRHGINSPRYKSSNDDKETKLKNLWKDVSDDKYMKQTNDNSQFLEQYRNQYKDFCVYGDDYVYRYLKIDSKKVNELIEMMVDDIKDVVNSDNLWNI